MDGDRGDRLALGEIVRPGCRSKKSGARTRGQPVQSDGSGHKGGSNGVAIATVAQSLSGSLMYSPVRIR